MRKSLFVTLSILIALVFATTSCQKDPIVLDEGDLDFSSDTVYFDSLFTGFGSPSERLMVRNTTDHDLRISKIWLDGGEQSEFSILFDGLTTQTVEDYILESGDSAIMFINYTSDKREEFARDRLFFQIGDAVQVVEIEAFVMDAVFIQDSVLQGIQTLDPGKRYVIDGYLIVATGSKLIIPAGTTLYFTPRKDTAFNLISRLEVWGTLEANGAWGNEVVFKQVRLGEDYEETPGQWRGLRFYSPSKSNKLTHVLVKNALIGIEIDSVTNGAFAKVSLDRCEIRNMAAYGIMGLGFTSDLGTRPMVSAEGCLFHNCKEGTAYFFGGGYYKFYNCSFVNYGMDFIRNAPQLGITNYYEPLNSAYPMDALFSNCIVWGSEEEEVVVDSAEGLPDNVWTVTFDHCMVRTTEVLNGNNIMTSTNQDYPMFEMPTAGVESARNYRLREGSPAIGVGRDNSVYTRLDLDDKVWELPYDLGCYNYR